MEKSWHDFFNGGCKFRFLGFILLSGFNVSIRPEEMPSKTLLGASDKRLLAAGMPCIESSNSN